MSLIIMSRITFSCYRVLKVLLREFFGLGQELTDLYSFLSTILTRDGEENVYNHFLRSTQLLNKRSEFTLKQTRKKNSS